jgi:hypothetical protein
MLMTQQYTGNCSRAVVAYRCTCRGGEHVLRKVLLWAFVIFIIYYLATNPTGAAHALHAAFNGLKSAGNSMSQFVSKL